MFNIFFDMQFVDHRVKKKEKIELELDYNWSTFSATSNNQGEFDVYNLLEENMKNSIDYNFSQGTRVNFLIHIPF